MKRTQLIALSLAGAGVLLSLWLFRTSPGALASQERAARQERALSPVSDGPEPPKVGIEIDTWAVRPASVRRAAEVAAVLAPVRRVIVAAEVEGRVTEIAAAEYSEVEEGAPLVRLEAGFLQAAMGRAEGALMRSRANHDLARSELERQRGLSRQRVASAAELDRADGAERARAADVREAEAALADARLRLSKSEIVAPFAGVVANLDLDPGAYVRRGDAVAEVLDLSQIEVEVGLTEREIIALDAGDPALLHVDVFPGETFQGVVTGVGSAADARTQKYTVQIRVPNPERRLLPGMLGRVAFELGTGRLAIRVPRRAVQSEFELSYVFVVDSGAGQSVLERRRVQTRPVAFRPDLLEVTSGLSEGEQIAVSRIGDLRDELPVRLKGTAL